MGRILVREEVARQVLEQISGELAAGGPESGKAVHRMESGGVCPAGELRRDAGIKIGGEHGGGDGRPRRRRGREDAREEKPEPNPDDPTAHGSHLPKSCR